MNVTRPINTIKPNQDNISTSQGPQTSRPAYQGLNSIQTAARGLQASPTNVNAIRSETAPRFVNPLPYLPSLPSLPKKATGTLATVASRSNTDGFEIIDIKPASKMVSPKPDVHTASIKKNLRPSQYQAMNFRLLRNYLKFHRPLIPPKTLMLQLLRTHHLIRNLS